MDKFPQVRKKMENLALLRASKFLQAAQTMRRKEHRQFKKA